jgi:hypothetical protein
MLVQEFLHRKTVPQEKRSAHSAGKIQTWICRTQESVCFDVQDVSVRYEPPRHLVSLFNYRDSLIKCRFTKSSSSVTPSPGRSGTSM